MQIISDFYQDTQTEKQIPGSYEWWYYDAQSKDGYSLVIIFYEGNPFSRRYIRVLDRNEGNLAADFPAISISIYKYGEPIFYSFEEVLPKEARFSPDHAKGNVGENSFEGNLSDGKLIYKVKLNQSVANGERIIGELSFTGFQPENVVETVDNQSGEIDHQWNLVMPKCEVKGVVNIDGKESLIINFEGTGYHDHNTGFEPMKESFDEWYWGRYHFKDYTLVYYLMNIGGRWEKHGWLISDESESITVMSDISEKDYSYSKFALYNAKKIEISGEGMDGIIQKESVTDSGPFYQRFGGSAFIKTRDGILKGEGISEYIRPDRIYSRIFWPLVNMRIKYPGKAHWVQKSSKLYRWTW